MISAVVVNSLGLSAVFLARRLCGGVAEWRACQPVVWLI